MQDLYEVGFQSPYGELGNTTNQLRSVEDGNPAFQSPYGELGNTTCSRHNPLIIFFLVSVPLRGIG